MSKEIKMMGPDLKVKPSKPHKNAEVLASEFKGVLFSNPTFLPIIAFLKLMDENLRP